MCEKLILDICLNYGNSLIVRQTLLEKHDDCSVVSLHFLLLTKEYNRDTTRDAHRPCSHNNNPRDFQITQCKKSGFIFHE